MKTPSCICKHAVKKPGFRALKDNREVASASSVNTPGALATHGEGLVDLRCGIFYV